MSPESIRLLAPVYNYILATPRTFAQAAGMTMFAIKSPMRLIRFDSPKPGHKTIWDIHFYFSKNVDGDHDVIAITGKRTKYGGYRVERQRGDIVIKKVVGDLDQIEHDLLLLKVFSPGEIDMPEGMQI